MRPEGKLILPKLERQEDAENYNLPEQKQKPLNPKPLWEPVLGTEKPEL